MHREWLSVFVIRALVYGLGWWTLTDGATGWDVAAIGVPAVILAAGLSAAYVPPVGWSWLGALKFAGFFFWESLRGGVDVARRALDPRMPLAPEVVRHAFKMRRDIARVTVANVSSLLPGSLCVDVDAQALHVHALDAASRDAPESVALTERRVAGLFREPLESSSGAHAERGRHR